MEGVYILHFESPLLPDGKTYINLYGDASHYVGRSGNLDARLKRHRQGHAASKTKLAKRLGINYTETILHLPNNYPWEKYVTDNIVLYCDVCRALGPTGREAD